MRCRKVNEYMELEINLKMALKQFWCLRIHYRYYDVWNQMKFISYSGKKHAVRKSIKNYYARIDIVGVYWGHSKKM